MITVTHEGLSCTVKMLHKDRRVELNLRLPVTAEANKGRAGEQRHLQKALKGTGRLSLM